MRTETEIKALPLEERQKLVIELRNVKTGDKAYSNAKAIITLITEGKGWKEPATVEVKNIADHEVNVDGVVLAAGATGNVFRWQYFALARFLEPGEKLAAELLDASEAAEKKASSAAKVPAPATDIAKQIQEGIAAGIAAGLKAAGKSGAAAMIALLFCLLGFSASAQVQPSVLTGPNYRVVAVNGYAGYTNLVAGNSNVVTATTYFIAPVTNTLSIYTNASWSNVNGIWTNTPTYTTNTQVNYPGLVSVPNVDMLNLTFGGQLLGAGTGTNAIAYWDYSADGTFWQTNAVQELLPLFGTTWVSTNVQLTLFAPGFIRLDSIVLSNSVPLTNVLIEVGAGKAGHGLF